MRDVTRRFLRAGFGVAMTCGFAMCKHAAPAPVIVPIPEVQPVAPPPLLIPAVSHVSTSDARALDQMEQLAPGQLVPAAVSPTKPPLDGGLDGGVPLPPMEDGGMTLRDAGLPMGDMP
jgi:hypothetical protein